MDASFQKLPNGEWNYDMSPFFEKPRLYLAAISAAVYALLTIGHIFQGIRHKTKYMIPMILGCIMELVGWSYRYLSIQDPFDATKFVVQYIAIIIAPILITTSLYTLLEKIMHASHPSVAPFKKSGAVFMVVEVLTLFIQVGGAGIASQQNADEKTMRFGSNIMVGGIALQLVSFSCYLGIAGLFYKRAQDLEVKQHVVPLNSKWKHIFNTLVISSIAVFIRSIFRLIEFIVGYSSALGKNELYLYGFDFLLMAFAVTCVNVIHPGRVLNHIPTAAEIDLEKRNATAAQGGHVEVPAPAIRSN
ncbi:hypothetical protein HDU79_006955 [Rhizoclosmatium sp. JEL0117]|nr:hypothetical protein HDU79_006955 [Rhizoclosmatium sp. JEL0117]